MPNSLGHFVVVVRRNSCASLPPLYSFAEEKLFISTELAKPPPQRKMNFLHSSVYAKNVTAVTNFPWSLIEGFSFAYGAFALRKVEWVFAIHRCKESTLLGMPLLVSSIVFCNLFSDLTGAIKN